MGQIYLYHWDHWVKYLYHWVEYLYHWYKYLYHWVKYLYVCVPFSRWKRAQGPSSNGTEQERDEAEGGNRFMIFRWGGSPGWISEGCVFGVNSVGWDARKLTGAHHRGSQSDDGRIASHGG